jgi:excisionase family DNA binding protein
MPRTRYLTPNQVAATLALSPYTIRKMLRRGELVGIRAGNGPKAPWRIPETELTRYAARHAA